MRRKDTKKKKTMIQYYDKKNYHSFYISSYLSIWRFIKTKKLFKFLKKCYIGSCHFVVFYVQKCLFSSFSRLRSPLRALKK